MRRLALSLVALAYFFPLVGQAANPADAKIGYVDMTRAINEVEEGKNAKAKLKTDFEQKQHKLDKMQTDLKAKKDDLDKRGAMMKADARQAKAEELQRDYLEVQKYYMQVQQELMDNEKHLTTDIGGKLRNIIEKIGDRDGHLVILNTADNVLYYKRHMDITDDVIRDYNKQFGGGKS